MRNLITDVPGLMVGNAQDLVVRTGVTVILPDAPVVASADIRGGAPGTRESDLMAPSVLCETFDAFVFSGGSLYGLDAATGVMHWLRRRGRGTDFVGYQIPSVPSAIVFDLFNGGDKSWADEGLYRRLAEAAAEAAGADFALGSQGAGTGTQAGGLKGGLGSASQVAVNGATVGALAVVNPFGQVLIPGSRRFWAADFAAGDELGQQPPAPPAGPNRTVLPLMPRQGTNTTLVLVATDMCLTKAEAQRVAMIAQDGLARAIHPVHTPFDGDVVFCCSTGRRPVTDPEVEVTLVGMAAAEATARAIARGVYEATSLGDLVAYRDLPV